VKMKRLKELWNPCYRRLKQIRYLRKIIFMKKLHEEMALSATSFLCHSARIYQGKSISKKNLSIVGTQFIPEM
jgi:hypothetical protein